MANVKTEPDKSEATVVCWVSACCFLVVGIGILFWFYADSALRDAAEMKNVREATLIVLGHEIFEFTETNPTYTTAQGVELPGNPGDKLCRLYAVVEEFHGVPAEINRRLLQRQNTSNRKASFFTVAAEMCNTLEPGDRLTASYQYFPESGDYMIWAPRTGDKAETR